MADVSAFFDRIDRALLVVTAGVDDERAGCLVGFSTQCSIYPARLLACLSVLNHTSLVAARAEALGVHVLGENQVAIARRFGSTSGDEVADKFAGLRWHRGSLGLPILDDCNAWAEGSILERIDLGDHIGYLLELVDGGAGSPGEVLRLSQVSFEAGHAADEVLRPGLPD